MGDGSGRIDLAPSGQGEMRAVIVPVERAFDLLSLYPIPTFAEPKRRRRLTAVGDELLPLAVGDAVAGNAMRVQEGLMAGPFGVEGKALASADIYQTLVALNPGQRFGRLGRARFNGAICGF